MEIKINKKLKTILKVIAWIFSITLLCVAIIHFTLVYYVSSESVRLKVVSYLQEKLNTQVNIEDINVSIFDFELDKVEIKLNDEDFVYVNKVYLHFSLIHLLVAKLDVKRITVDTLTIHITKNEDGTFNFEKLLEAPMFAKEEQQEEEKKEEPKSDEDDGGMLIRFLLHRIQFQNISCFYTDNQNNLKANLTNIYFNVNNFSFDKPFVVTFSSKLYALVNDIEIDSIRFGSKIYVDLADMYLSKASLKIANFQIRYKDFLISSTGDIVNFKKPEITIETKLKNLSSNLLEGIAEVPEFLIPLIEVSTNITADLENSLININKINIDVLTSTIKVVGFVNYAEMKYKLDISIDIILSKLSEIAKLIEDAKPEGKITSILTVTNENISGNISLEEIGAYTDSLGYFKSINSLIEITSINDIKTKKLSGLFNKNPFYCNFSYLVTKDCGYITTNFKADKFIAKPKKVETKDIKEKEDTKTENTTETKEQPKNTNWKLPPFKIKSNCKVGVLDVPFFRGEKVNFKVDVYNVTPNLDTTHGFINLDVSEGTIQDVYTLTDANVLTKSLFMSLKVISDVINALNVLDLLKKLGSVLSPDDKSIEEEADKQVDGKIDFHSFVTKLNFDNGVGSFEQCNFVSNLLSFKVSGKINFKEDKLDMTVNAAPGKHELDGTMPLTMRIKGTTENPEGSLSLLGSVSNLVGDLLMKNAVTGNLKKGFLGIFKSKKADKQNNEDETLEKLSTTDKEN